MRTTPLSIAVLSATLLLGQTVTVAAQWQWSGSIAGEWRGFFDAATDTRQENNYLSLAVKPELFTQWDDSKQQLTIAPYLRIDSHDDERDHFDFRQLDWLYVSEQWELRAGIRKVFWGVTESQHLVDIINQTDLVEDIDGEEKLGQPMVNLALIRNWGTVDFYLLPGFRERTFPDAGGRPRTQPYVDTNFAHYQSSDEQHHLDWALRWFHSLGDWDIGVSHFSGTGREPLLIPTTNDHGEVVLSPYYELIEQTGIDLQATKAAWLWKLEAIYRRSELDDFFAVTSGFEYTFYGIKNSAIDLGIVMEYLFDDRGAASSSAYQDDIMLGFRLNMNDPMGSEALLGIILDRETQSQLLSLEASRRLSSHWKLQVEARLFHNIDQSDPLYSLRNDNHVQMELAYYY